MSKTKKRSTFQARQGDVFITAAEDIPATLTECPVDPRGVVLAEGEATGHHHRVGPTYRSAVKLRSEDGREFLRVGGGGAVALTHEEHAPISIPPGLYEIWIQREYQPDGVHQVVD